MARIDAERNELAVQPGAFRPRAEDGYTSVFVAAESSIDAQDAASPGCYILSTTVGQLRELGLAVARVPIEGEPGHAGFCREPGKRNELSLTQILRAIVRGAQMVRPSGLTCSEWKH